MYIATSYQYTTLARPKKYYNFQVIFLCFVLKHSMLSHFWCCRSFFKRKLSFYKSGCVYHSLFLKTLRLGMLNTNPRIFGLILLMLKQVVLISVTLPKHIFFIKSITIFSLIVLFTKRSQVAYSQELLKYCASIRSRSGISNFY